MRGHSCAVAVFLATTAAAVFGEPSGFYPLGGERKNHLRASVRPSLFSKAGGDPLPVFGPTSSDPIKADKYVKKESKRSLLDPDNVLEGGALGAIPLLKDDGGDGGDDPGGVDPGQDKDKYKDGVVGPFRDSDGGRGDGKDDGDYGGDDPGGVDPGQDKDKDKDGVEDPSRDSDGDRGDSKDNGSGGDDPGGVDPGQDKDKDKDGVEDPFRDVDGGRGDGKDNGSGGSGELAVDTNQNHREHEKERQEHEQEQDDDGVKSPALARSVPHVTQGNDGSFLPSEQLNQPKQQQQAVQEKGKAIDQNRDNNDDSTNNSSDDNLRPYNYLFEDEFEDARDTSVASVYVPLFEDDDGHYDGDDGHYDDNDTNSYDDENYDETNYDDNDDSIEAAEMAAASTFRGSTLKTALKATTGAVDVNNPLRFYDLDGDVNDDGSDASTGATLHFMAFNEDETVHYNQKSAVLNSTGVGGVRYVKVQLTGKNYLHLAEVEVFDANGVNVARGKTASQSSTYKKKYDCNCKTKLFKKKKCKTCYKNHGYPSLAVDGNYDTFSKTNSEQGAWWKVNLGQESVVTSVVLYQVKSCCQERLSNSVVELLDGNENVIEKREIGDAAGKSKFEFTFGSYIEIPPATNLGSFTIAMWVFLIGDPARYARIIDFGSPNNADGTLLISPKHGNCGGGLGVAARGSGNSFLYDICTSITLAPNEWNHIALTYNKGGAGAKFYLDGAFEGSNTYSTQSFNDWPSTNAHWFIGRSNVPSTPFFKGRMQDLRIYDTVLSPSDVQGLAYSPKGSLAVTFEGSGLNDVTRTVMPTPPMRPSTWSSLDLNQAYLRDTSELTYSLPEQAFSQDSVATYLNFDFTPNEIGAWHRIRAYGVELFIAGTDNSKTYTDKAASANTKKSYRIKLSGKGGFAVNSRQLVLDQSGSGADSTFGNVAVSLECPESAVVEKTGDDVLCRCAAGHVAQALDDQGKFQDTGDTEVDPDPTKGKCVATWGFAMDETSTSIRLHGMNLPTSLQSSVSSVKVTAYQRASSSERTVVFKYNGKTLPKDNLIKGYNLNGLVSGRRYDVEAIPIEEKNGNRVELTESKIMQSVVTHCSCSANDDATGSPGGVTTRQENGYVFFEWRDRSRCEEGFALSRRTASPADFSPAARYVRIRLKGEDYLHLREVEVYGVNGNNVALNKPASQSSDYDNQRMAFMGNDGNYDTTFHTNSEQGAWWRVDLGGLIPVTRVVVYNRIQMASRLSNSVVELLGDDGNTVVDSMDIGDATGIDKFKFNLSPQSSDLDEIFKPNVAILKNGQNGADCPATPIVPGVEAADDLRVSHLLVGTNYVYCIAATAPQYMHNPSSESAPALTSSSSACRIHKINWEASISGRVTLSPSAGSHPVRDAMISWELLDSDEEDNIQPRVLASGSSTTGPSGLFNIKFNEALHLLNDKDYPVRVRASKTTNAGNDIIHHRFLCDKETTDCTDAGTLVYLRHLDFDEPLRIVDATSVPIRGKIVVAETDQDHNDDKENSNSGDGCILQGIEVCLKQKHVQTIDTDDLCVKSESDGTYELPATIGTNVTVEVRYENHTFAPLHRDASLYEQGILVEPKGDNDGHDFKDTTVVDLIVEVAGGLCSHKLGESTVSIEIPGGCKWRKDLNQDDVRQSHQVPAQLLEVQVREIKEDDGKRLYAIEEALASIAEYIDLREMKEEEEGEREGEESSNSTSSAERDVLPVTDSDMNVVECEEAEENDVESEGRRVRFQYDGQLQVEVRLTGDDIGSECGLDDYETTSPCDSLHVLTTLSFTEPEVKLVRQLKENLFCDIVEEDLKITLTNELGTLSSFDKQFWGEYPSLDERRRALLEMCSYDSGSCSGQVVHDTMTVTKSLPGATPDGGSDSSSSADMTTGINVLRRYKLDGNALDSGIDKKNGTSYYVGFEGNIGPGTEEWGVFSGDSATFISADDSYIEIPPATDLGSFSVAIWVFLIGDPVQLTNILDFGSSGSAGGAFVISLKHGSCNEKLGAHMTGTNNDELYKICSEITPEQNQWHHVASTYDKGGEGATLYFNGEEVGFNAYNDQSFEDWSVDDNAQWLVGKSNQDGNPYFNGRMQDLHVYNYTLSKSVVEALYEQGQAGSTRWHHDHAKNFIFSTDDYQFRYNKELLSWDQHERLAQDWGGHLASFYNQSFNDFLFELKDHGAVSDYSSFWVGLKYQDDSWQWLNSTDAEYNAFAQSYWAPEEPSSSVTFESRGYSSSDHEGKFHSAPASIAFPAVYKRKRDIVADPATEATTCALSKKKNAHITETLLFVGPPNRNGDHTRSLFIQAGPIFHRACVVVTGDYKLKEVGSFGLPTHEPILVLRDPPGGLSYASYENVETSIKLESREFEQYVGFDLGLDLGIGGAGDTDACVGLGAATCNEVTNFKTEIGLSIGGGGDFLTKKYENWQKSGGFTSTWTYQTSDNPWLAGSKSDAFVVPNLDVKFSQVDTFTWKPSTCTLVEKTDYKFNLEAPGNKPALSFVTHYDLETYEIPQLEQINASHSEKLADGTLDTLDEEKQKQLRDELSRVQEGLFGWKSFLDKYEETNKEAKEGKLNDYVPSTWFEKWVKAKDLAEGEPTPDNHWSGLAPESLAGRAVGYGAETKKKEEKIESDVKEEAREKEQECTFTNTCLSCCKERYDPVSGSWTNAQMKERKQQAHKEAIRDTHRIKFSGGGGRMEFSLSHEMMNEVEEKMGKPHENSVGRLHFGVGPHFDFKAVGLAFELDADAKIHFDWSQSHKLVNTNEKETTISFVLGDEEESDRFSVDMYIDPRYGTFIFSTQGGQSRCPHEEGTMAVGAPKINLVKWPTKPVLPEEWMIFNLELTNEGADMASFELVVDNNNGILDVDYRFDSDRFDRFGSKDAITAVFAVRKGPSDYAHDPFKLTLRQVCEGEAGTTGYYSDIGHDSVEVYNNRDTKKIEFAQPCPVVDWAGDLKRDRSFSFNKKDEKEKLKEIPIVVFNPQYSIGSFTDMLNTARLQSVHLWYRAVGRMDWEQALDGVKQVDFADSSLESIEEEDSYGYTVGLWKFGDGGVQDGVYEIMVETKCETIAGAPDEFNFIRTPSIRGVIDRQEPKLYGLPKPHGNVLQLGEPMYFTFSKEIDCEKPYRFQFDVAVTGFGTAFNNDNLLITCQRNEISFTFDGTKTSFIELKNNTVSGTLTNVVDLVGNPTTEPIQVSKDIANVNLDEASTSFTMELMGANCVSPFNEDDLSALRDEVASFADLSPSDRVEIGRAACAGQGRRIVAEVTVLPWEVGHGRWLFDENQDMQHSLDAFEKLASLLRDNSVRFGSGRRLENLLSSDAIMTVKDAVVNPSPDDILRNPQWTAVPIETDVVAENLDDASLMSIKNVMKGESQKIQEKQSQMQQEMQEKQTQMQQEMQEKQTQMEQDMQQAMQLVQLQMRQAQMQQDMQEKQAQQEMQEKQAQMQKDMQQAMQLVQLQMQQAQQQKQIIVLLGVSFAATLTVLLVFPKK